MSWIHCNDKFSSGVTPSERFLNILCTKSFLSIWSYSNLFTNEGRKKDKGAGKELCDLLVIFEDDILIFSDKCIEFKERENITISWSRWFKNAIIKSANQLYGAEQWIRKFPDRIYLDRFCQNKFPLTIPDRSKARFHRIAVALGVKDACKKYFGGNGSGSLIINSDLEGKEHFNRPFNIGHVNRGKGFVHVLDDFTINTVLQELDTISDFVTYLNKKEAFLTQPYPIVVATGEEELLAVYLTKLNENGDHDFIIPEKNLAGVSFQEGFWGNMVRNPKYVVKKREDRISYTWDKLIEHFIASANEQQSNISDLSPFQIQEQALRVMASESRFRRRQLGYSFINLIENTPSDKRAARLFISNDFQKTAYVFLIFPPLDNQTYSNYRDERKALLYAYCKVAKLITEEKNLKTEFVVGIATEPKGSNGGSEALVVIESKYWTQDMHDEAKIIQKEASLFLEENIKYTKFNIKEYPDSAKQKKSKLKRKLLRSRKK
jgi:hypothetical protein